MRGHAARLHGRIAVSAAARHFIDRFFPGDYKVIPNGVDIPRFAGAVPLARWQDGTPNVLFVGRHEPRKGLLDLLKAHRILRRTGYENRLLVVGSGPQEREARRYVATRGLQGGRVPRPRDRRREGPALPDGRRLRVAGDRRRVVRDRPARGDGRRRADRRLGHPRLQGRRPARSRGPARPAARAEGAGRWRSAGCWPTRTCGPRWAPPAGARAEEFSWPRVTAKVEDYYGFVIRRLAASGSLPEDFRAPIPQAPPLRARPSASSDVAGRQPPPSASVSLQTQAE